LKNGFQAATFKTTGKGLYSGAGVSGGLSLSFSSTDNIYNLAGSSYAAGGSFGELFTLGGERSENSIDNSGVYTLTLGVGFGLPAESHLFLTETTIGKGNVCNTK